MGVEELGLLVMLQRVQGALGPVQLLHDEGELEPGLVAVRGQLHHPAVAALGLLQAVSGGTRPAAATRRPPPTNSRKPGSNT